MKEIKKSYIATIFKFEQVETSHGNRILVCVPIEYVEGTVDIRKNSINASGNEFLPAYDALLKGKNIGYIFKVSYDEMLEHGKKSLLKEHQCDSDEATIIQNYKREYIHRIENNVWYFDLTKIIEEFQSCSSEDFYKMYGVSIDHTFRCLTTKAPLMIGARADFVFDDDTQNSNRITRIGLVDYTKKYVISQDKAVELAATAIYNPIALKAPMLKQNVFIYGPAGSGKTYILKTIAQKLGLPFYYLNIGNFSASGYAGDLENYLYTELYNAAGENKDKLERGAILFIDNVDELNMTSGIENALLPLYKHDGIVNFKPVGHSLPISYNKKNLIIVSSCSLANVEAMKCKNDFANSGISSELLERFDLYIPVASLHENDLYRILAEGLESPYITTKEALKKNGINFQITNSALRKIAAKSFELKRGVRSLRGIFEFATRDEIASIVDKIHDGTLSERTYVVSEESIGKKLEFALNKRGANGYK